MPFYDLSYSLNGYHVKFVADSLSPDETLATVAQIATVLRQLPPVTPPQQSAPAAQDVRIMAISHITRSHDGEKEVVRVHGEPWMKFGVAVYADSCKVGYDLIPASLGKKELSGYEAQVAMKGDNPSRVIGIQPSTMPF